MRAFVEGKQCKYLNVALEVQERGERKKGGGMQEYGVVKNVDIPLAQDNQLCCVSVLWECHSLNTPHPFQKHKPAKST